MMDRNHFLQIWLLSIMVMYRNEFSIHNLSFMLLLLLIITYSIFHSRQDLNSGLL